MPNCEFYCNACKKTFTKILTLVDYEAGGGVCPHCGSNNVEQCCSAFSVITSRRGAWGLSPITPPKGAFSTGPLGPLPKHVPLAPAQKPAPHSLPAAPLPPIPP